jgi:hypothetical protein
MPRTTVTIFTTGFSPNPVTINAGDSVDWLNSTNVVQDATGDTFTTGPIQPASSSMPLSFDFADPGLNYTSTTGLSGTVIVLQQEVAEVHWLDVQALFTDEDVQHMLPFGLNLADQNEVCTNFDAILERVTANGPGRMPPPPRPKWTADKVNILRAWKAAGCPD